MTTKVVQGREALKTQIAGYEKFVKDTAIEIFDKLRVFSREYKITPCPKYEVTEGYFSLYLEHAYGGISDNALKVILSVESARFIGVSVKDYKLAFLFHKDDDEVD